MLYKILLLQKIKYIEISKKQVIIYLNYIYDSILKWANNYELITQYYKEIEAIIEELELF